MIQETDQNYSIVGFIPARSGSKRIENKNIKLLNGHPLIAYTIESAKQSGIFDSIVCVTNSKIYADIAIYYGAEVPILRPDSISESSSPDIEWVQWIFRFLSENNRNYDAYCILRPTSPFRSKDTIRRGWDSFLCNQPSDSLRAVQKCIQHPGKMWEINGNRMTPLISGKVDKTPYHSSQYAALPEVYAQDASLEIAWSEVPLKSNTISGNSIIPFLSSKYDGFDINNKEDWILAEHYINNALVDLPKVDVDPYEFK